MRTSPDRKSAFRGKKKTDRADDRIASVSERQKKDARDMKAGRRGLREALFIDLLRIPSDVAKDEMRLTALGRRRLVVENYRGILEYTGPLIRLRGKNERICVEGEQLCIEYYTAGDIMISGSIKAIKFERPEGAGK
ncbi:MAG: YabP/YqfC family sporulation protein [Lachnospiraceae bacterium]|nr:YabP/YqfC family sporulation protein [Lachnospiraceae bacterium]